MENFDNNDLIEQYLSGALPPEEKQAFETRMAMDAAFRADVELHRQLQEEFADPQKLQLRDFLTDMLKEPPPAPPSNNGWLKWPIVVLVVFLFGWLGWHWFSPNPEISKPAVQEEIKSPPPSNEPVAANPDKGNIPVEPVGKTPERPIAQVDPAAYTPNQEFERRLGSMIRSTGGAAEMISPAKGATIKAENGVVKINFRGNAEADGDTARFPLVLKIYDNQVNLNKSLYRILPAISNRDAADGQWTFASAQRLRLKPGLYYYTVERMADEDLILAGKFRVE